MTTRRARSLQEEFLSELKSIDGLSRGGESGLLTVDEDDQLLDGGSPVLERIKAIADHVRSEAHEMDTSELLPAIEHEIEQLDGHLFLRKDEVHDPATADRKKKAIVNLLQSVALGASARGGGGGGGARSGAASHGTSSPTNNASAMNAKIMNKNNLALSSNNDNSSKNRTRGAGSRQGGQGGSDAGLTLDQSVTSVEDGFGVPLALEDSRATAGSSSPYGATTTTMRDTATANMGATL